MENIKRRCNKITPSRNAPLSERAAHRSYVENQPHFTIADAQDSPAPNPAIASTCPG